MYIQTLISENIKLSLGFILHLFWAKNINLFRKYFSDKDMTFVGHLGVELDLRTSKGFHKLLMILQDLWEFIYFSVIEIYVILYHTI